jgi:hypothetical protein
MRIVAIKARHSSFSHATQSKPRLTVVFVSLHTIGPENARLHWEDKPEVVVKTLPYRKFVVKLFTACMA